MIRRLTKLFHIESADEMRLRIRRSIESHARRGIGMTWAIEARYRRGI